MTKLPNNQVDLLSEKQLEHLYYMNLYLLQEQYPEHYAKSGLLKIIRNTEGPSVRYSVELPRLKMVAKGDNGNANTRDRYIGILLREFNNPVEKTENYRILYNKIIKNKGIEAGTNFLYQEVMGILYIHNGNEISSKPYCFAYDFDRLAEEGAFFTDIADKPAQHLDSFVQHIIEFVAVTCRETTGAVGMPALFPYMWYFWNKDVESGYVKDKYTYLEQQIQMLVYKLNGSEMRMNESAFTNVSVMDESYIEHFFGDRLFPNGEPIIKHVKEIVELELFFLRTVNDILAHKVITFPVITDCVLYDAEAGKFVNEETARKFSDLNMQWENANFYAGTDISTLSSCCRVLNNIDTMNEKLKGFANFIGGSDLNIGSVGVVTVNLPNIVLGMNADKSEEVFLDTLRQRVLDSCDILHSVRDVIADRIEEKALKVYDLKLIDISRQFNTVGFIGLYDAAKMLGLETDDDILAFEKKTLALINEVTTEYAKEQPYSINIEQIPGESACVKLATKDALLYGEEAIGTGCYSNQWIPLSENRSINDRSKFAAELDKLCGGGSILHLNIDSPFTNSNQAWDMLNNIAKRGVIYFAFNNRISVCEDTHGFYGNKCWCGKDKIGEATRPVGFITIVPDWIPGRQAEYKERKWIQVNQ